MGQKGDKMTEDSVINTEVLLERLSAIDEVTSKKMFGGHGIMYRSKMFGMVNPKGVPFLKVNHELKEEYAKAGSEAHSKMPYMSIPKGVLNDPDLLEKWAKRSIALLDL